MNIQPIDLPSLLRAVIWPLLAVVAFIAFRRPLGVLVTILGQRVHKFSVGGFSMELAEVSEMKTQTLETEIRQLDAGLIPQSGSNAISQLLFQLQTERNHDYITLDLGSETSPRWLTSRLYLLAFLITLIDRPICMVFVETNGGVRKRFVGTAAPNRVRWALGRRYGWFETASAAAYATLGGVYCNANILTINPASSFQFDATTGSLAEWQVIQLMQSFLHSIRGPQPIPPNPEAEPWVPLNDGVSEHAKWVDGARIERLLGADLNVSSVVLMPNQTVDDLGGAVPRQQGRYVAVLDTDRSFRCLVDRMAALESLSKEFRKQTDAAVSQT
jgi:hypothetical protein